MDGSFGRALPRLVRTRPSAARVIPTRSGLLEDPDLLERAGERMGKVLAVYNGAANDDSKHALSEEQQSEFMRAWGAWARAYDDAIIVLAPRSS